MHILDVASVRLPKRKNVHLSITLEDGANIAPVGCVSLFPLSDPESYISIVRTETCDEPEVGIVRNLGDLPEYQRDLVIEDLNQRRFLPEILDVVDIVMVNGMDEWKVETDRGEKVFYVNNRKDNITVTDDNMLIITFGAKGGGITDDGPAIRKAVEAAVKASPRSKVVFEKKRYRLAKADVDYHISLLTLKGVAVIE